MQAYEERAAAAAKKDFFTKSLADMRLVQSKVNRAVVEAQQRCAALAAHVFGIFARLRRCAVVYSVRCSDVESQRAPARTPSVLCLTL